MPRACKFHTCQSFVCLEFHATSAIHLRYVCTDVCKDSELVVIEIALTLLLGRTDNAALCHLASVPGPETKPRRYLASQNSVGI